jgi:hypothetical protein
MPPLLRSARLLAAIAALMGAPLPPGVSAEAFGRWQQRPASCVVEQGLAPRLRCHALQLDQRSPQVLRLSVQAEGPERGEVVQLTLVGSLAEGSAPMGCRNGACSLKQPLELSLISLSLVRFNGRGLAQSVPSTWSVRGSCQIDRTALRCEAVNSDLAEAGAPPWTIEAELR